MQVSRHTDSSGGSGITDGSSEADREANGPNSALVGPRHVRTLTTVKPFPKETPGVSE
jgi:hypothetical protein